jgi:hydrogenase maturation protease
MAMTCEPRRTVVLGLGNPLMADDGLGLVALERLRAEWEIPDSVTLADGGTWGMMLLPMIEEADELLLLDAIRAGQPPGTFTELAREQLPRYFAHKLSPHQIDLREVLALTELRGTMPARVVAIGAEPERVEMSTELTPVVEARVDEVVQAAVHRLAAWGHVCQRRAVAVDA